MTIRARASRALVAALLLVVMGCERREEARAGAALRGDTAVTAAAQADPEMLRRHAVEAEQMVAETREHLGFMWRLPPREVPGHAGEHARRVEALVETIERQTREMDRGMGMGEARMGEMMGIRADQYRLLREEMQIARAEAAELQTASEPQVREQLRGHLDRLARILDTLEASAAHRQRLAEQAESP